MHKKKIFLQHADVYVHSDPDFLEFLKHLDVTLEFLPEHANITQKEIETKFSNCDICIVCGMPITARLMDLAPSLKLIAVFGSGYNNIDISAASARRIYVTNARGGNATAVAELTIASMLNLARGFLDSSTQVKQNIWISYMGTELFHKTYGIVGMGAIGGEVARIARLGFQMNILAYDPFPNSEYQEKYGVEYTTLENVFSQSDFISIHAPLTGNTVSCIDYTLIKKMKPSAFLANAARGGIILENDLLRALNENLLRGAALDVFENEPYNSPNMDNPFSNYSNQQLITTPHMAACTYEAVRRIGKIVKENVLDILNNRIPRHNIVNHF
ncbi:MAG: phosphoglycerate dehydrogenase [Dorea sp.]|nr:phosphoglycerate dehydrogenase [Dorea sp.]